MAATVLFTYLHSLIIIAFTPLPTVIIMLFPTLSVSVLGFAAIACAGEYSCVFPVGSWLTFVAPHSNSARSEQDVAAKREAIMPSERGLTWTPRKRQSSSENLVSILASNSIQNDLAAFAAEQAIIINQFEQVVLAQEEIILEQQLVALVQEQLFVLQAQTEIIDNIRINHFNAQNSQVVSRLPTYP